MSKHHGNSRGGCWFAATDNKVVLSSFPEQITYSTAMFLQKAAEEQQPMTPLFPPSLYDLFN